jgi:hypothetical protein
MFVMLTEFVGIMFFSFIMGSVNTILAHNDYDPYEMFELKTRTDIWIHNIEALVKERKTLPNELYLSIKYYLINQISYEHCKLIS